MDNFQAGKPTPGLQDSKQGTPADKTLQRHASVPVKDIFTNQPKDAPGDDE